MSVLFRVTLLELISAQLNEEGSEKCGVPPSVAHFLAGSFQKGCGAVLTLATGSISSDEVQHSKRGWCFCTSPSVLWKRFCRSLLGAVTLSTLFFFYFSWTYPGLTPLRVTPACCNCPLGPAGGADSDKSAGRPVWNDLRPHAVYGPAGLSRPSGDHRW